MWRMTLWPTMCVKFKGEKLSILDCIVQCLGGGGGGGAGQFGGKFQQSGGEPSPVLK